MSLKRYRSFTTGNTLGHGMTQPRKQQVSRDIAYCYHVYGRCVRQSFLFGLDQATGIDYSHRRAWILDRLALLCEVFTIDIAAYAILHNHYHVCVFVDWDAPGALTDKEVAIRWRKLTNGNRLVDAWLAGKSTAADNLRVAEIIDKWRSRLADLSWFMKSLNEYIARLANQEENRKGSFWEGRFKCRALLDDAALLSCMTYVDLNPIRAELAHTPEESDFTSIQQRIREYHQQNVIQSGEVQHCKDVDNVKQANILTLPMLRPFIGNEGREGNKHGILCHTQAYFELVEWTGRCIHQGKRGVIPQDVPPILERLNINPDQWLKHHRSKKDNYDIACGSLGKLKELAQSLGKSWLWYCRLCLNGNAIPT